MATVPDPPTNLVATPGVRQITVAFTPGADGGSPITNYQYSLNSGSFIAMSPPLLTSPMTITNLYDATPYTIIVQAINSIGTSQSSVTISATTFSLPPAPTNLVSTAGNSQISVAFTQTPAVDSPIINYQYSLNNNNYVTLFPPSTQSPIVIRGLYNLSTYQVRLQSISKVGSSADSVSISAPTLYYSQPPSDLSFTPGNGSITISFTPGLDGGSPILNYYYTINGGQCIPANPPITSSPLTISGLQNNTTYRITLLAYTAVGLSLSTLPINASTYSNIPPPTNLSFVGGIQQVSIYFTPSTSPYQIINYQYSLNGGSYITPVPPVTTSPLVISGLIAGVTYKVQLRTLTTYGPGATYSSIYASPISVPKPPVLISYTPGNLSAAITFTLDTTSGSDIMDVLYSINGGALVSMGTIISPYTITGLANNTTYSVQLAQQNVSGRSPLSNTLLVSTYASPPAPTGLLYIAGDSQVTISFAQPTVPNMAAILNYQYSTDNGATFFAFSPATGPTSSVIIRYLSTNGTTPLSNNGVYNIKLMAVNVAGNSSPSSAISATTFTSPSPPTALTAASSYTSVSIGFTPGNNGGLPITNYQYSIDNGAIFTACNPAVIYSPITISGLVGSTTYQVKLKAVNSAGASVPSATVSASTYYGASPPTGLIATSGDRQVSIAFTAGASGNFPITNYQYSIDNGATYITRNPPSAASPILISNLANGTVYQIKLKSITALGPSSASAAVTASTYYAPNPPTGLSSAPGYNQVSISFTAGSPGSFPVSNYQYSINGGATFVACNPAQIASPVTITGLLVSTVYQVQLKAVNTIGPSLASATVSAATYYAPGVPVNLSAVSGNNQVSIYFTAGSSGSFPITNYQYSTNGGTTYAAFSPAQTGSPLVITGLASSTVYQVKIKAVNSAGVGDASVAVRASTNYTPNPPTGLSSVTGSSQITIYFTPGSDGGSPITNYLYSIDNGANFATRSPPSTASPLSITGLGIGATYYVVLKAMNAVGTSGPSAAVTAYTYPVPNPPTGLSSVPGNSQVTIYFTPGADGGNAITNYLYSLDNGANFTTRYPASAASPLAITGLGVGATYLVGLKAVNAIGTSVTSAIISASTNPGPPPPATTSNYSLSNPTRIVQGALWKTWDIPVDCNITNIKFNVSGQIYGGNGWGLFYIWYVYNGVTTPLLPDNGFYPPANGIPTGEYIQEVNIPLVRTNGPPTPQGLLFTSIKKGGKLNMYFSTLETYRSFITRVLNNGTATELPFSITYQPT